MGGGVGGGAGTVGAGAAVGGAVTTGAGGAAGAGAGAAGDGAAGAGTAGAGAAGAGAAAGAALPRGVGAGADGARGAAATVGAPNGPAGHRGGRDSGIDDGPGQCRRGRGGGQVDRGLDGAVGDGRGRARCGSSSGGGGSSSLGAAVSGPMTGTSARNPAAAATVTPTRARPAGYGPATPDAVAPPPRSPDRPPRRCAMPAAEREGQRPLPSAGADLLWALRSPNRDAEPARRRVVPRYSGRSPPLQSTREPTDHNRYTILRPGPVRSLSQLLIRFAPGLYTCTPSQR